MLCGVYGSEDVSGCILPALTPVYTIMSPSRGHNQDQFMGKSVEEPFFMLISIKPEVLI